MPIVYTIRNSKRRAANDYSLGPKGLLVTGLNMSGKSTFLGTIGINLVGSQSLGLAFAESYRATPLRAMACMGVSDINASLAGCPVDSRLSQCIHDCMGV